MAGEVDYEKWNDNWLAPKSPEAKKGAVALDPNAQPIENQPLIPADDTVDNQRVLPSWD